MRSRGLGWHETWIFPKGKDLNQKLKRLPKLSKLGDVVSKVVKPKHITYEGLRAGRWAIFLKKKSYFNTIWITFRTCLEPFGRTKFLKFESQLKKSNW